jgi:hypothetical protein
MNTKTLKRFFKVTTDLIEHNKQLRRLRGENFNLFNILRVESAENNTHSNFIAELLNPKGSHDLGIIPLQLFLEILDLPIQNDLSRVKVFTEYHLGTINNKTATGGRIDILLQFPDGSTISVENKIYANDQYQQIKRYCNYNVPNNKVYYLSLTGKEPSVESKGDLKCGSDYFILSYRQHILEWLQNCLKEAANQPVLRESIKQYITLIKKLTNTLEKNQQTKLRELMFDYFEEAEYISSNYTRAVYETKDQFRKAIKEVLIQELDQDLLKVSTDCDVDKKYSQVWIDSMGIKDPQLRIGIEPFSGKGHHDGHLYIGIFDRKGEESEFHLNDENNFTDVWLVAQYLRDAENNLINLNDPAFLKKVSDIDSEDFQKILKLLVKQIKSFLSEYLLEVETFLKNNSVEIIQESESH